MIRDDIHCPKGTTVKLLLKQLADARGQRERALAHYRLGLLHDRNDREGSAIPHYLEAIELGLPKAVRVQAFAWLASSYYKCGYSDEAIHYANQAFRAGSSDKLKHFLAKLVQRAKSRSCRKRAIGRIATGAFRN